LEKKLRGRQNNKRKTLEYTTGRDRSPMEERRNGKEENKWKKEQGKHSDEAKREKAT
jgi:hypothetical protein